MVERIRALLVLRQLTPTQFADLIQVGRPIVSHILSGRNKASLEVVQRIIAAFPEVALPWLLGGTGAMLAEPASRAEPQIDTQAASPKAAIGGSLTDGSSGSLAATSRVRVVRSARLASSSQPNNQYTREAETSLTSSLSTDPRPEIVGRAGQQTPARFSVESRKPAAVAARSTEKPLGTLASEATATQTSPDIESNAVKRSQLASPVAAEPVAPATADSTTRPRLQSQADTAIPILPGDTLADVIAPVSGPSLLTAAKPIRRIVIFYHDGSFADYQPES